MDASPELAGGSGAAGAFVGRLRCLTNDELAAVARRVGGTRATAADDLDLCRATVAVSVELHRLHRSRAAAIASQQVCEAVLDAPGATEVPHDPVVHAARAAGDFARSLVAGGPPRALAVPGRGWEDLVGTPTPRPSRPLPDAPARTGARGGHGVVGISRRSGCDAAAVGQRPLCGRAGVVDVLLGDLHLLGRRAPARTRARIPPATHPGRRRHRARGRPAVAVDQIVYRRRPPPRAGTDDQVDLGGEVELAAAFGRAFAGARLF